MAAPPIVSVHLRGVTFSHSSAVPVLSDVTLDLGPGRHGLVGANGAGKSTFLDLVDGSRAPSPGDVTVIADGPVVRLRQDPDDLSDEIARFGQRWDGDAVALRRLLDLDVDDLWQWDTRSPGRRMQWQVAAALAVDPDVLLLDEPTNHLDAHARDLLVTALDRARVPLLVVVSHDRAVLDRLTSSTLRVVDGTVQQWAGSWTAARRRWEAKEAAARDAHDAARRRAGRARSLLAASRSRLSGVERGAAASRRAAGAADSDTRSAAAKAHAQAASKSLASTVAARRSAVERATEAVADTSPARRRGAPVVARAAVARRASLVRLTCDEVRAGDLAIARDVDLSLGPSDRVRIAGPNGAGKTTLVRALLAELARSDRGSPGGADATPPATVGMLAQEVAVSGDDRARLLAGPDRHRVLAIVDHLGVDPERVATTDRLSPGEARKLVLADLLARPREVLVLDEPTNHLDIEAIGRLQDALAGFGGALVLVTHDEELAAATTDLTWTVGDGRVVTSSRSPRHPLAPDPSDLLT